MKHHLPLQKELVVHCDLSKKDALQCAEKLLNLEHRPDAVFCVNDPTAIQLMLAAKKRKIKVPEELGIVGFSNDPISEVIEPALTTVQQPVADMGKAAMRILLDTIKAGTGFNPIHQSMKTSLIVRASSVR